MSRTFRNRHTIPKGWVVRDDGYPYLNGSDCYGNAERSLHYRNKYFSFQDYPRVPKYRRSVYRCETGWARRFSGRQYRNRTNLQVRNWKWDDILPPSHTGGWLSW